LHSFPLRLMPFMIDDAEEGLVKSIFLNMPLRGVTDCGDLSDLTIYCYHISLRIKADISAPLGSAVIEFCGLSCISLR
jgi:hypothetical protein